MIARSTLEFLRLCKLIHKKLLRGKWQDYKKTNVTAQKVNVQKHIEHVPAYKGLPKD